MSEPINHDEAEHLALLKMEESNLARCYLDMKLQNQDLQKRLYALEHHGQHMTCGPCEQLRAYDWAICGWCDGTGKEYGSPCPKCEGAGGKYIGKPKCPKCGGRGIVDHGNYIQSCTVCAEKRLCECRTVAHRPECVRREGIK